AAIKFTRWVSTAASRMACSGVSLVAVPVGPVVPRGMAELPEPAEQPAIKARAAAHSAPTQARRRLLPLLRGEYAERNVMKSDVMTGE
ncbi:MAG: hypothetical protein J2P33_21225, partial [Actinobacteria bacterium]|nr:hypothetical protein [Actinomycetota bacterium]